VSASTVERLATSTPMSLSLARSFAAMAVEPAALSRAGMCASSQQLSMTLVAWTSALCLQRRFMMGRDG
jgi:hypothetical protein